jgi:PiT family inorganic phosphate transporter
VVSTALVVVIVAVALFFDYTNGFHDAANAIATSVSTKALTPRVALAMAAVMNVAGALISTRVATTIYKGLIDPPQQSKSGLVLVLAALLGAIVWNLGTWYFGLPSSSSHALIGGLVGAALAASESVKWSGVVDKVIIPMVASPIAAFVLSYLFMLILLWTFRRVQARRANIGFKYAQIATAATMAFGHGTQDAQKTMGVIFLALSINGDVSSDQIPLWVILAAAAAISLGTYSGGWRIMRTLGRRIFSLTPASGFAAQTVASGVMLGNAVYGLPVSTTHAISASVMGVGATRRFSAVRWGVAGNIVFAWVLTIPAAGATAALMFKILNPILT